MAPTRVSCGRTWSSVTSARLGNGYRTGRERYERHGRTGAGAGAGCRAGDADADGSGAGAVDRAARDLAGRRRDRAQGRPRAGAARDRYRRRADAGGGAAAAARASAPVPPRTLRAAAGLRRGQRARRRAGGRTGAGAAQGHAADGRDAAATAHLDTGRRRMSSAEIGVFGGSGFYSFLDDAEDVVVDTPYGPTSDRFVIGDVGGKRVAFMPRHGRHHNLPPHAIPYRANLWAMKELGVRRVIGPCASGSLAKDLPPGTFVVCDQFVDRTSGRADTFYDGPVTTHVSSADPYCPDLRSVLLETGREQGLDIRDGGTVVVIQGPRFSTRAESKWFSAMGWG